MNELWRAEAGQLRASRLKRVFDVVVAVSLLVAAVPLMAIVATMVRLTSAGPVLFSQMRVGRNGARFRLYKFRTMCTDAEDVLSRDPVLLAKYLAGGHKLCDSEDARITPIGRVLRRLRLDELPQLYNVLRGEMTLVGPRPIVPAEVERYSSYVELMRVTPPGVTGLWQVSGETSADYSRREAVDREYIRTSSLGGDVAILLRTLALVTNTARQGLSNAPARRQGRVHPTPDLREGE